MTLHSCHIHVAILTSGYVLLNINLIRYEFFRYRSTPDFILSTYITPITQLAKQIQENQSNIDIQV